MDRTAISPNLLVISDIHLGEALRPAAASMSYLRRIATLERELEAFLAHYTTTRIDGRPWRLVVNGDMVDFMSVMILPREDEAGSTDEERRFGLALAERQTVEKLDRVMARHAGVFRRLAQFVAAGNELVIVVGNHDAEFHYPAVQRRFVELLGAQVPALAPERVRFCPWFYYEEERVYVEHGHQYDEYCSFDYLLHPVEHNGHLAMSIAHAGIRYFTNLVPSINPHIGETWGFIDFIRWAWGEGARGFARIFYIYGVMVWKVIELWSRMTVRATDEARRELHRAELGRLADVYRITVDKVHALDGLRCLPVHKRFAKILQAFYVDRLAILLLAFVGLFPAAILPPGWHKLAWAAGLLATAGAAILLLGRNRMLPSPQALRRAPELIGRIVRAPFIVFGHSHEPEAVPLPDGGVYFNTGAWANEDVKAAFTHLVISSAPDPGGGERERPRAELRQWRDGGSVPYTATRRR